MFFEGGRRGWESIAVTVRHMDYVDRNRLPTPLSLFRSCWQIAGCLAFPGWSLGWHIARRKGFRAMGLPLSEIARLIDGTLTGNDLEISGAATLPVARPGE